MLHCKPAMEVVYSDTPKFHKVKLSVDAYRNTKYKIVRTLGGSLLQFAVG
jgi:hypothetical protein